MSHHKAECSCCYEESVEELNILLMKCPEFKDKACKEIQSLTKKLAFEAKLIKEAHEVKEHIKIVAHELNPLEKIKMGFLKFKLSFKKEHELFQAMVECERPKIMIVCCSDSRVDPCSILGLKLGEAHVLRNIINCIPPYSDKTYKSGVATIEYAISHLKVEHIIVIGHNKCQGLKKLEFSAEEEWKNSTHKFKDSYNKWLLSIGNHHYKNHEPCPESLTEHEHYNYCEKESINNSLWNCLTYPCVKEAISQGKLIIHGGYYNLEEGSFERWSVNYKYHDNEKYE